MARLQILTLDESREAAPAWQISPEIENANVERFSSLAAALERLSDVPQVPVDVVVLHESRPGQWTEHEVGRLRAAAPLVRILRLTGPWCDGQLRSGRPPAGTFAIGWDNAAVRLRRELDHYARGEPGLLSAPSTATSEDLLLNSPVNDGAGTKPPRTVAIVAPRAAAAAAWAGLCRKLGYGVRIGLPGESLLPSGADLVLWDCDARELASSTAVRGLINAAGDRPVLAVAGFPRPADVQTALESGVLAVLSKPLLAADLADWLAAAIRASSGKLHSGPSSPVDGRSE